MTRALITGGAGFVGSHLASALLAEGREVRLLDNLDPLAHPDGGPGELVPADAELVRGDLRDRASVGAALEGVEEVFHLGGVVGNGESLVNVRRAVDANAGGTATLMEEAVARRDRIRRVVVASSMVVYGEGPYECPRHGRVLAEPRPAERLRRRLWEPACRRCGEEMAPLAAREDDPLQPLSVYAITKRDTEELALVLGRAHGLETVALRYLNVYGPGQALGNPYTGVAAIFAARARAGRPPLVFEDGRQIRDFVHVSDVARAMIAAMAAPGAAGRSINVATGRSVRIAELAGLICEALGSALEPEITGEFRAGDVRHCLGDARTAREVLGFEPRVALEDGLPPLAEWVARQDAADVLDGAVDDLRDRGLIA